MKIVLKPLSHPEIGEITVTETVFPIGRRNPPFAGHDPSLISDLSRRHARVFQDNEIAYIADLSSLNGTTVNGEPVDNQPRRLNHGDEISLAGKFRYKVEIETDEDDSAATAILGKQTEPRVTLTPCDTEAGLDRVEIDKLPFLISKSTGVFASYRLAFESQLKHISRRHAYVFLNQDKVMVEDMGSTNGTFVSSQRLDEQPRILKNGDVISFGGDFFTYSIEIITDRKHRFDDSTHLPDAPAKANKTENPSRQTTLVVDANPFQEIFSNDDEIEPARDLESELRAASPAAPRKPDKRTDRKSIFSKFGEVFSPPPKETKNEKPGESRLWRILAFLFIAGILGVVSVTYMAGPERQIKSLFLQERYLESAQLATEYLDTHPANTDVLKLATSAILNTTVPAWQKHLNEIDYAAASALLKDAEGAYPNVPDARQAFDVLGWIIRVKQLKDANPDDEPVNLFSDGASIKELVEWWEKRDQKHLQTLERISRDVTSFKDIYLQTLGDLRTLKKQRDAYAKSIENLVDQIRGKLNEERIDEIDQTIREYERKHKKVAGINALKSDLNNLLQLINAFQDKQLAEVLMIQEQSEFRTSFFSAYASQAFEQEPPQPEVVKVYRNAIAAWQNGDVDQAIRSLTAISEDAWGSSAKKKLKRYQDVLAEYQVLVKSEDTPDFNNRLLAFRGNLKMPEDKFILRSIDAKFDYLKTDAMKDAKAAVFASKQQWDEYQQQGGISGLLRLEDNVSDAYRKQAKRLSRAKDGLQTAVRIYEKINEPPPSEWSQLYGGILEEINKQRNDLRQLSGTLDDALLEKKFQLIDKISTN